MSYDVFNDPEDEEYATSGAKWIPDSISRRKRCYDLSAGDPIAYRYLWSEMPVDELYMFLAMNNAKSKEERDRNRRKKLG